MVLLRPDRVSGSFFHGSDIYDPAPEIDLEFGPTGGLLAGCFMLIRIIYGFDIHMLYFTLK